MVEHNRVEIKDDAKVAPDGEQNELDDKGEVRKGVKKTVKIHLNKET